MSKLQSIKTRCPLFPGFYNTLYEMDTESVCYNLSEDCDHDVGYDDVEWDNAGYEKAVCIEFVSVIEPILKDIFPAIKKVEFIEEISPREYNFTNDKIEIEVKYNRLLPGQIRTYLRSHTDKWEKFLEDHFKSRSGFSSFYPYDPLQWILDTKNYTDLGDGNHLWAVLEFACLTNEDEDYSEDLTLYYKVIEGVYPDEFAEYKGVECVLCGDQHTKNVFRVCGDCVDNPEYVAFLQSVKDHQALMATSTLPGIDLKSVQLVFNPSTLKL